MARRRDRRYFARVPGAPEPVRVEVKRKVHFSEADVMGIAWHGRYPQYFEEAAAEIGRKCGLSYKDFYESGLRAPIVEIHIDYSSSLFLDEEFTVAGELHWHDGARLNTEFRLIKSDGTVAASGYTVQLFIEGGSREVCITVPALLERCQNRWKAGEFH